MLRSGRDWAHHTLEGPIATLHPHTSGAGNLPLGTNWKPVDPVVADPVRQDNDKRNNIQIYTEIPY